MSTQSPSKITSEEFEKLEAARIEFFKKINHDACNPVPTTHGIVRYGKNGGIIVGFDRPIPVSEWKKMR